jgi:hypothetical protein
VKKRLKNIIFFYEVSAENGENIESVFMELMKCWKNIRKISKMIIIIKMKRKNVVMDVLSVKNNLVIA